MSRRVEFFYRCRSCGSSSCVISEAKCCGPLAEKDWTLLPCECSLDESHIEKWVVFDLIKVYVEKKKGQDNE